MKHLSQTVKIGLALLVALFSNGLLPATAAYATRESSRPDGGTLQPVWCKITGNAWQAQLAANGNGKDGPLTIVVDGYENNDDGQVMAHDRSDKLDAACATQYGTVLPVGPTTTPICGVNNDIVTFATTANVTYTQTGWSSGSNTVTASANTGYTVSGTSSWVLTDIATAGCVEEHTPATPVAPTVVAIEKCGEYGSVVFAETEGIEYTLTVGDGKEGAYTVTATAKTGYVIADGATSTFSGNLGVYTDCEDEAVTCPKNSEWYDINQNEIVDENECFKKVFVCKYVGTPFINERLQTGDNPISVSVNAIKDFAGIGSYFNDQQGRSYVLEFDEGQTEPSVDECPAPEDDAPVPVLTPKTCLVNYASLIVTHGDMYRYTITPPVPADTLTSGDAYIITQNGTYTVDGYKTFSEAESSALLREARIRDEVKVFTKDYVVVDANGCGGGGQIDPDPEVPVIPATPVLPVELPHTGPAQDGTAKGLLLALGAAIVTYGAVYFAQPKRRYE